MKIDLARIGDWITDAAARPTVASYFPDRLCFDRPSLNDFGVCL